MPSNPILLVPGFQFQHYSLVEAIGSSTDLWRAEDTRTGGPVVLKVLSRHLPDDPGRREEWIAGLREAPTLRHPHLVSIREIGDHGDLLYLTMEVVQGEPISRILRRGQPDRKQFFRLGCELIGALDYLHSRQLVHGNVDGENVLLTRTGGVKLAGFSLANLAGSVDPDRVRRRLNDPRAVSYMAPEAIRGAAPGPRSDLFSFGCVMYEALTGRTPFAGTTAEEIATAVMNDQPASPKKIKADVDSDAVAVIGRCLFKDPSRRPATAGEVRQAILAAAPELATGELRIDSIAPSPEAPVSVRPLDAVSSPPQSRRDAVIWVAELANFSELETDDPSRARKSAARMHQILGEAAHLFDGTVSDDSGPRMVAEMPDASRAYQAGRKGEHDLEDILDGREPKPLVRIVLHAGELDSGNATITGEAVEEATGRLTTMPPGRLFMTETFVSRSGGIVKTERATGVPGVLYVGSVARQATAAEVSDANATIAIQHPGKRRTAKDPAELTTLVQGGKSIRLVAMAAAILLILAAVVFWLSSHREAPALPSSAAEDESAPTPARPHTIALASPVADGADPALSERAAKARMAAMEILRSAPELRVADSAGKGADLFGARVQRTAAGDEMIPLHPAGKRKIGQAFAFVDAASGAQSLVAWICAQLRIRSPDVSRSQEALDEFADAVAAYDAKRPAGEVDHALKASMAADPSFVPLQLFAMRVYSERRDLRRAADSARQVLSHDAGNVSALQTMARFSASGGDAVSSIGYWNLSLQNDPRNVTAINALGRFALAANDPAVFERAVGRLRVAGAADLGELHPPDLLVASGKIAAAVDQYYDLELKEPDNPALALKIGRISVLRHSGSIADLELKKLQTLDPLYSRHLLEAYIAAQAGQKEKAATELELAAKGAPSGGDLYTSAAEIAAMTADTRDVVTNLERALKNSEPTASYVLVDPLFGYLRSDSAFQSVRDSFASQRDAIKAALQRVKL